MSYLTKKYKGVYKLRTPYDPKTNQFPREYNGKFAESDIYIECSKGIQVSYYGKGLLSAYIPSIQTGHNILKQIYGLYINPDNVFIEEKTSVIGNKEVTKISYNIKDKELFYNELKNNNTIQNLQETDEEVLFNFKASDDEKILPLFKPRVNGANRNPFSSKNLPKAYYEIPEEDISMYKELTKGFSIENGDWLKITRLTKEFINSLANKKNTIETIKSDMAKKCISGKEYIHSINKWNEYIEYLQKNL